MDLKKMIDNELRDLNVTDSLKRQTLVKIKSSKKPLVLPSYFKRLKELSLVSSFVMMIIVGINLSMPKKEEVPKSYKNSNINIPQSQGEYYDKDLFKNFDYNQPETTTTTEEGIKDNEKGR